MWPFKKVKPPVCFETASGAAVLTRYAGEDEYYRIPDEYEGLPVTEIAPNAFRDAKRVKGVFTGANIKKIGKKAFSGCCADLRLILNPSAERAEGALTGCKWVYIQNPTGLTLVSYAGQETNVVLEDECFGIPVTGVGEKVFYMFAYLASVRLPIDLRFIGRAAFAGCSDLTGISLPSALETIEAEAFVKSGLTSLALPESIKLVGERAFFACKDLKTVRCQGKFTHLSAGAFAKCGLTDISLPESLTEMQSELLRENKSLTRISIPKTVEAVWEYALADTGLLSAELPETTELIGEGAFSNSKDLKEVRLGSSVREIGPSAFSFCPSLQSLRLPGERFALSGSLLIDTETNCLLSCLAPLSPQTLIVPDGVTAIGDLAFAGNDKIERLTLPKTVNHIGVWALRDMKNLNALEILSPSVTLAESPLLGTSPETLLCPNSVREEIENYNS